MNNNGHSRLFHHFIQRSMPCILLPSPVTSSILTSQFNSLPDQSSDHILNLSASMIKHCPLPVSPCKKTSDKFKSDNVHSGSGALDSETVSKLASVSPASPQSESIKNSKLSSDNSSDKVDMNCNKVKITDRSGDGDDKSVSSSPVIDDGINYSSENDQSEDEQITEIDVDIDDSLSSDGEEAMDLEQTRGHIKDLCTQKDSRSAKVLAFGIDQILSSSRNDKATNSPTSSPSPSSSPVVSNLSTKSGSSPSDLSSKLYKDDIKHNHHLHHHHHHSILTKLRLCASSNSTSSPSSSPISSSTNSESHKRSTTLPFFHHSYGPYHHHHHHPHHPHINPIITSGSGGGIHNHNSHQHPLSNCSECLFLRRYCGGGFGRASSSGASCSNNRAHNIPSSSASSANNAAANNMQFSSAMATPCGPTSSLSASFTWMANPTIYDNSPIIPPGYNQHIPLQPSFGLGPTGFSTLSSIQQCTSGNTSGRRKRSWSRAVFSNLQRKGLEKRFQLQKYITKPDRRQLAATLGLTDAQVKVWFQNRRMKWRHSKEGKVSSGTGDASSTVPTSSSSPPVSSTTSSKGEGVTKDKKL